MKNTIALFAAVLGMSSVFAQNPAITNWMINTTGLKGSHYVQGNSTPIQDDVEANVQQVEYSSDWVYVHTHGIPAYTTGPFLDNNPSLASDQDAIFRIPLKPTENTGTKTETNAANIGIFINGVALFDYRDGVSWSESRQTIGGGPLGQPGDGVWNRDAIPAEMDGFDCNKAHPAQGNYHHHQNPSAFNLDKVVVSEICDLYPADGLYNINPSEHSPLLGYAYDGFPIYGAYGYKNTDGTGGIVRIESAYHLRSITQRTHYADGSNVTNGPNVNGTYYLGYFREDYEFVASAEPQVLDEHNGRFCVTPEYPQGTYAYFATVDENWNSAYPYAVGPTFYGNVTAQKVNRVNEPTTVFDPSNSVREAVLQETDVTLFPNPAGDFIAVQLSGVNTGVTPVRLLDNQGKLVAETVINQGSTITFFKTETLYNGTYFVQIGANNPVVKQVIVAH